MVVVLGIARQIIQWEAIILIGARFFVFTVYHNGCCNRFACFCYPKNIDIPYSESLENIHQITFDEEIEKALGQRNYRLAIRLLYLSTLKQLNDANFIQWQVDKTNSAYVNELTDAERRQSFSVLTRQFEYVWYGDFFIDGPSFQNINALFQDFKQLLR